MNQTLIAIEHQFDQETINEINELRALRLQLAQEQFQNAENTIQQLIDRKLIDAADRIEYSEELKTELAAKIEILQKRIDQPSVVHFDEIELYVSALDGTKSTRPEFKN